jgi:RNA recognition motif-containing protein
MTGRIYIRDFSYDATAEDLSALISKVCPVEEVYISGKTPTGINRSFAIVVLNGNDLLIEKCIKTFNNCHWKGTKIWVEKAKVYYKDKFEMERARERKLAAMRLQKAENVEEEAELEDFEKTLLAEIDAEDAEPDVTESDDKVSEAIVAPIKVKASLKHVIKLKKSRDSAPVAISMVPTSSSISSGDSDNLLIRLPTILSTS